MRSNTEHISNTRVPRLLFLLAASVAISAAATQASPESRSGPRGASPSKRDGAGEAAKAEGWTIVLAAFSGPDAPERAAAALLQVQGAGGLPEARVQERGRGLAIVYGNFAAAGGTDAQQALARVRAIEAGGARVFAGAFLAPPRHDGGEGESRWALATAREEFGKSVRYTLQIGVYESADPKEAQRAAEKAAGELRRAGEPAYYYHGHSRSMVTVGAFTEKEARAFLDRAAGQTTGQGAPELWELHRRHPQNLLNGNLSLVEKSSGADKKQRKKDREAEKVQSSFLVEIP